MFPPAQPNAVISTAELLDNLYGHNHDKDVNAFETVLGRLRKEDRSRPDRNASRAGILSEGAVSVRSFGTLPTVAASAVVIILAVLPAL